MRMANQSLRTCYVMKRPNMRRVSFKSLKSRIVSMRRMSFNRLESIRRCGRILPRKLGSVAYTEIKEKELIRRMEMKMDMEMERTFKMEPTKTITKTKN
jgi:hypothetical protein